LPEGFVQLSDAVNAIITPDIYTEVGYVYLVLNLGKEEIDRLPNEINLSTLAFYRLNESNVERVSDYYNSGDLIPLNFMSNRSGIYVLAAERIQPEKPIAETPVSTPTPTLPSTPSEQPRWIPGFEAMIAVGILVALLLVKKKGK
jgi:hypothetical protein